MEKRTELEKKIVELKLEKRELLLSGKSTDLVDEKIKIIEEELENIEVININK